MLALQSGSLLVNERGQPVEIRVLNRTVRASDAYFAVTVISPSQARITVAHGEVAVVSPAGPVQVISDGEFATLVNDGQCNVAAVVPQKISDNELAMEDQATLQFNRTGRLEPVAELADGSKELDPVGELLPVPGVFPLLPSVGVGPSVPFDLANPRVRLLRAANPANTGGPVQSPVNP